MASFVEKIQIIIDTQAEKAVTGFRNFRTAVSEAEGGIGKLKAGLGSLKEGIGSFLSSGVGMATVATGVATGLYEAVHAAEDLALEVGKLRDATGLSAEAASRWLEVAGDMGIGADKVAGLIEKLTKNLGANPAAFAGLGVELQHTASGAADMNATLLLAIDRLIKIQDPTARAAAAQKLFGKSWSDAAELVAMGANKVKEKLDAVDSSHIVDNKQVDQAREFRDVMDDLGDVTEGLALDLGKTLMPVLTEVAKAFKTIAPIVSGVTGALGDFTNALSGNYSAFTTAMHSADELKDALEALGYSGDELTQAFAELFNRMAQGESLQDVLQGTKVLNDEMSMSRTRMGPVIEANKAYAEQLAKTTAALWDQYKATVANLGAADDLDGSWQSVLESLDNLNKSVDDGSTLQDEHVQAVSRTLAAFRAYATQAASTATDAGSAAQAQIDAFQRIEIFLGPFSPLRANLDAYIAQLRIAQGINPATAYGLDGFNPFQHAPSSAPAPAGNPFSGSSGPIVVQTFLDGRIVAESVTDHQRALSRDGVQTPW